jgi:hypothetical protein
VSKETRHALDVLSSNIRKNSARINRKLSKAGVEADPALVLSAAKYFQALNKLAKA